MRGGAGEVRRRAPPPVNIIGASASLPLIQRAHATHAASNKRGTRCLARAHRPQSRIYKRNSTRAIRGRIQLFTRLSALTTYGALKRRVPGLSTGERESTATKAGAFVRLRPTRYKRYIKMPLLK